MLARTENMAANSPFRLLIHPMLKLMTAKMELESTTTWEPSTTREPTTASTSTWTLLEEVCERMLPIGEGISALLGHRVVRVVSVVEALA